MEFRQLKAAVHCIEAAPLVSPDSLVAIPFQRDYERVSPYHLGPGILF